MTHPDGQPRGSRVLGTPGRPRRRFVPRALAAGLIALAPLAVPCVWGGGDDGGADLARRLRAEGVIRPLEDLLSRAQSLRPGTLIDARLHREREHDTYVYEIHMLDGSGVLWEVEFDARSGEMLELELEDP